MYEQFELSIFWLKTCEFQIAIEAISNIRTVVALGCEDIFYNKFVTELGPHNAADKKRAHVSGLVTALGRSTIFFACTGIISYGIHLMVHYSLPSASLLKSVVGKRFLFLNVSCVISGSPSFPCTALGQLEIAWYTLQTSKKRPAQQGKFSNS